MRKTFVGLILLCAVVAIFALGCSIAEAYPNPFVCAQENGAGSITQGCLTINGSHIANQYAVESPKLSIANLTEVNQEIMNVGRMTQLSPGNFGGSPLIDLVLTGDIFGLGEGGNQLLCNAATGNNQARVKGGGQLAPTNV